MYNVKNNHGAPTGVCLVVAVGLTQDLTLILLTKKKNTKQNKTNKNNKNSYTAKVSGEGFIVKNICCVLLPASLRRFASGAKSEPGVFV